MPTINGVSVTQSQAEVYNLIERYGPIADHALVPLAQHQLNVRLSSSGLRTRRSELYVKGLIREDLTIRTGSGRRARTFVAA